MFENFATSFGEIRESERGTVEKTTIDILSLTRSETAVRQIGRVARISTELLRPDYTSK